MYLRHQSALTLLLVLTFMVAPAVAIEATWTTTNTCASALAGTTQHGDVGLSAPLRVAIWNAMKFQREGSRAMLERVSKESDLVLLQESVRGTALNTPQVHSLFSDGYANNGVRTGVEIRSVIAADVACSLRFMEPWLRTPKAIGIGRYRMEGGVSLLVVNLHGINFTFGASNYAKQLAAIGKLLTVHKGPVIVGGDFNNWSGPRNDVVARFVETHSLSTVDISPDWRSRHLGHPVDALFVRGLRSITGAALPTNTSDHNPITALLKPVPPGE